MKHTKIILMILMILIVLSGVSEAASLPVAPIGVKSAKTGAVVAHGPSASVINAQIKFVNVGDKGGVFTVQTGSGNIYTYSDKDGDGKYDCTTPPGSKQSSCGTYTFDSLGKFVCADATNKGCKDGAASTFDLGSNMKFGVAKKAAPSSPTTVGTPVPQTPITINTYPLTDNSGNALVTVAFLDGKWKVKDGNNYVDVESYTVMGAISPEKYNTIKSLLDSLKGKTEAEGILSMKVPVLGIAPVKTEPQTVTPAQITPPAPTTDFADKRIFVKQTEDGKGWTVSVYADPTKTGEKDPHSSTLLSNEVFNNLIKNNKGTLTALQLTQLFTEANIADIDKSEVKDGKLVLTDSTGRTRTIAQSSGSFTVDTSGTIFTKEAKNTLMTNGNIKDENTGNTYDRTGKLVSFTIAAIDDTYIENVRNLYQKNIDRLADQNDAFYTEKTDLEKQLSELVPLQGQDLTDGGDPGQAQQLYNQQKADLEKKIADIDKKMTENADQESTLAYARDSTLAELNKDKGKGGQEITMADLGYDSVYYDKLKKCDYFQYDKAGCIRQAENTQRETALEKCKNLAGTTYEECQSKVNQHYAGADIIGGNVGLQNFLITAGNIKAAILFAGGQMAANAHVGTLIWKAFNKDYTGSDALKWWEQAMNSAITTPFGYWIDPEAKRSQLCQYNLESDSGTTQVSDPTRPDQTILFLDDGSDTVGAYIAGEKSTLINVPVEQSNLTNKTFYKINYKMAATNYRLVYNVQLYGQTNVKMFDKDVILAKGETEDRSGSQALVTYSDKSYTKVCLDVKAGYTNFRFAKTDTGTICANIVESTSGMQGFEFRNPYQGMAGGLFGEGGAAATPSGGGGAENTSATQYQNPVNW